MHICINVVTKTHILAGGDGQRIRDSILLIDNAAMRTHLIYAYLPTIAASLVASWTIEFDQPRSFERLSFFNLLRGGSTSTTTTSTTNRQNRQGYNGASEFSFGNNQTFELLFLHFYIDNCIFVLSPSFKNIHNQSHVHWMIKIIAKHFTIAAKNHNIICQTWRARALCLLLLECSAKSNHSPSHCIQIIIQLPQYPSTMCACLCSGIWSHKTAQS